MGDRANVYMKESADRGVYLYTHWGGDDLAAGVQATLKRAESRWSDGPYLARAIFCDMVKGHESELTGYGISAGICDNEHPIIVVDPDAKVIGFAQEPTESEPIPTPDKDSSWLFDAFIAMKPKDLEKLWINHGE